MSSPIPGGRYTNRNGAAVWPANVPRGGHLGWLVTFGSTGASDPLYAPSSAECKVFVARGKTRIDATWLPPDASQRVIVRAKVVNVATGEALGGEGLRCFMDGKLLGAAEPVNVQNGPQKQCTFSLQGKPGASLAVKFLGGLSWEPSESVGP